MTLRSRIALAMVAAAAVPMSVVVGLPLLRADARARADSEHQLALARRQAAFVVERERREALARVDRAAQDLARDAPALQFVLSGPETSANDVAASLADRASLDRVTVLDASGSVLASSHGETVAGTRSALAGLPERELRLAADPDGGRAVLWSARRVDTGGEPLTILGGRAVGRELAQAALEITGGPVEIVDPDGRVLERAGDEDAGLLWSAVPIEGGWALRVSVRPPDVRQERRELLATFAGVAPVALLVALLVGIALAAGVARPIRELADRADDIATKTGGFAMLERDRDEVRRLGRSFDRMLDALSVSEHRRAAAERIAAWKEVARRIAHEVKNPLSPIKLAVENLRRTRAKAPELFDRALEEETAVILEEVDGLRRLVDEFSQFARLPAPSPAPCDPRQLARQALALFAARIDDMGVRLTLDDAEAPERILADAEQVGRVLKNVVANALDAMEPVAERRLAVRVAAGDGWTGPVAVFEVKDSGVGLDAEAQRRIFEPYFTTRSERGGTGLGMAIAYRIATEHGGSIEAAGSPGAGATITLRLPVEGPHNPG